MRTILILLACAFASALFSQSNIQQSLSVNSDGAMPAASAQLDVSAADKGMLVPRMTTAQRTAIASPATGLLVFDTNTAGFWFYNGTAWQSIDSGMTGTPAVIADADGDTKIQVEKSPDEDIIRFDLGGTENMLLQKNAGGSPRLELPNALNNTFVGTSAGNTNTTGNNNAAFGLNALQSNTTGSHNTASGVGALFSNTTGYSNVAIGRRALYSNTDRSNLVAVGDSALYNQGTGVSFSFQAKFNTAVGSKALYTNTTGYANTANGYQTLFSNTTGYFNTANGFKALFTNTGGVNNTANGYLALFSNTMGFNNSANGHEALYSNTTGIGNTAMGHGALYFNASGNYNTGIGYFAGAAPGDFSNATAIGYNAIVGCSNCMVLGGTSANAVNVGIGTTNPAYRLDLNGRGRVQHGTETAGWWFNKSNNAEGGFVGMQSDEYVGLYGQDGAGFGLLMNIQNGNVGIGTTSPIARLEVSNGAIGLGVFPGLLDTTPNNDWVTLDMPATRNLRVWDNFSVSGNVGIGTSSPTHKLQVNGGLRVNEAVSVGDGYLFQVDALGVAGGRFEIASNGQAGFRQVYSDVALNVRAEAADFSIFNAQKANGDDVLNVLNNGNVFAFGNLTVTGAKNFLTDHPLDPANKSLQHACVESNEVLNVYSGTVTLDGQGKASVGLPDYFEALNKDFRYSLTAIGSPGPNLYISKEVSGNHFEIAGGGAGAKVSWQVTGVRNDPWFRDHPYQDVQEKMGKDKGRYHYPEGYGQPAEKSLHRQQGEEASGK